MKKWLNSRYLAAALGLIIAGVVTCNACTTITDPDTGEEITVVDPVVLHAQIEQTSISIKTIVVPMIEDEETKRLVVEVADALEESAEAFMLYQKGEAKQIDTLTAIRTALTTLKKILPLIDEEKAAEFTGYITAAELALGQLEVFMRTRVDDPEPEPSK